MNVVDDHGLECQYTDGCSGVGAIIKGFLFFFIFYFKAERIEIIEREWNFLQFHGQ